MHIIEEMVLFRGSQPVQHIELDTDKVESWERKPGPGWFTQPSHTVS